MTRKPSIGLVVQGGAMRTAYAAGALQEMELAGWTDRIALAGGSSAGALAMVAFMTGHAQRARDVLLDVLPSRDFIDPRRIKRIIDVDYLLRVFEEQIAPDFRSKLATGAPTFAAVTVVSTGAPKSVQLNGPLRPDDPYEVLRASMAIPVLYPHTVQLSVGECVDGGVSAAISLVDMLNFAPDILVVIATLPLDASDSLKWWERVAVRLMPSVPPLVRAQVLAPNPLNRLNANILRSTQFGKTRIVLISPSDPNRLVDKTCRDRWLLEQCSEMGMSDADNVLSQLDLELPALSPLTRRNRGRGDRGVDQ